MGRLFTTRPNVERYAFVLLLFMVLLTTTVLSFFSYLQFLYENIATNAHYILKLKTENPVEKSYTTHTYCSHIPLTHTTLTYHSHIPLSHTTHTYRSHMYITAHFPSLVLTLQWKTSGFKELHRPKYVLLVNDSVIC